MIPDAREEKEMEKYKEEEISEKSAGETTDFRSWFQTADAYLSQGRGEEAIEICREGVNRFPDFLPGRLLLGRCYLEAGRNSESQEQLEFVADVVEKCSGVYKYLSRVYLEKKEIDKAMEALQKALYLSWTTDRPLHASGEIREKVPPGIPAVGTETTRPVADLPPKPEKEPAKPIRTDTLADIYLRQGHLNKALSVLEEILTRDPGNTAVRKKYESLLKRRGGNGKKTPREKVLQVLERWLAAVEGRTGPVAG